MSNGNIRSGHHVLTPGSSSTNSSSSSSSSTSSSNSDAEDSTNTTSKFAKKSWQVRQKENPFFGLYSNTGFDMVNILSRVSNRSNPVIDIGPVDLSSSFLVVDARKFDLPITYVSESFEKLTGYRSAEIIGRNCRFLQSPDGIVERGQERKFVDNDTIYSLKKSIDKFQECQFISMNYKKGGEPFVNLITIIPVTTNDGTEVEYYVGFQCDLMAQSKAILRRLEDGTYVLDSNVPPPVFATAGGVSQNGDFRRMDIVDRASKRARIDQQNGAQYYSSPSLSPPTQPANPSPIVLPAVSEPQRTLSSLTHPQQFLNQYRHYQQHLQSSAITSVNPSMILPEPVSPQHYLNPQQPQEKDTIKLISKEQRAKSIFPSPEENIVNAIGTQDSSAALCEDIVTENSDEFLSSVRLLDQSPDVLLMLSTRGIILHVTPMSTRSSKKDILSYSPNELLGKNMSEFTSSTDWISMLRDLKLSAIAEENKPSVAEGGGSGKKEVFSSLIRFTTKSGTVWVEARGVKYDLNKKKKFKCFLVSIREKGLFGNLGLDVVAKQVLAENNEIVTNQESGVVDVKSQNSFYGRLSLEGFLLWLSECGSPLTNVFGSRTSSNPILGSKFVELLDISSASVFMHHFERVIMNPSGQGNFPFIVGLNKQRFGNSHASFLKISFFPVSDLTCSPSTTSQLQPMLSQKMIYFRAEPVSSLASSVSDSTTFSTVLAQIPTGVNIFHPFLIPSSSNSSATCVSYEANKLKVDNGRLGQEIEAVLRQLNAGGDNGGVEVDDADSLVSSSSASSSVNGGEGTKSRRKRKERS